MADSGGQAIRMNPRRGFEVKRQAPVIPAQAVIQQRQSPVATKPDCRGNAKRFLRDIGIEVLAKAIAAGFRPAPE